MGWIKVKAKNMAGEDYMKIVWENPPEEPKDVIMPSATLHIAPATKTSKKANK